MEFAISGKQKGSVREWTNAVSGAQSIPAYCAHGWKGGRPRVHSGDWARREPEDHMRRNDTKNRSTF